MRWRAFWKHKDMNLPEMGRPEKWYEKMMLLSFGIGEVEEWFIWSVSTGFGILTIESCGEVMLTDRLPTSLPPESVRHRDP